MSGLTWEHRKTINQSQLSLAGMPTVCGSTHSEYIPDTCVLCLDDLDDTVTYRQLPCSHLFHLECIDEWLTTRDASCPVCRVAFYDLIQPLAGAQRFCPNSRSRRPDNQRGNSAMKSFRAWCKKKFHERPESPGYPYTASSALPNAVRV